MNLAIEIRAVPANAPSSLWRSRCRGGRIAGNPQHDDFPALLAEALDHLAAVAWEPGAAAAVLGITSSQLVKLLKKAPKALTTVNRRRGELGKRRLK